MNDITEQKKFEEALRASEQNYREIFNATTEAIFIHDAQTGAILDVNDAMITIYGYSSKEEVLAGDIGNLNANEGAYTEVYAQNYIQKTLTEGPQKFEWLARKKDGTVFWIEIILKKTEIGGKNRILAVGRDISERKKTEEELQKKQNFIESIIENSPIGFALNTIDDGNGVYVGSKFEEIYGVDRGSLNSVDDYFEKVFIDPGYREQMRERIMGDIMSMDASRMKWDNIPITTKSGEKRIVNIANIPLFEQNLIISTVQDVTEKKLHEEGIIKAKEKAEESDRLKSALLNNMNHEIRTPMNAIMGFSDLMAEAEGEEKNQYAAIIKQSSNQLLTLIDDMIQLSRLQSEKMPLNNVKFNPANLVVEVSRMFNLPEVRKGLEIIVNIPDRYNDLVILSDADKIRQVLTNFVSNALKYTNKGCVELGFEQKGCTVEFYVKDTGIGIPKHEQERIFESFYRGKQALSSAIRGTGLGLSITKELVDLLKGTIGVSSEQNKGSRFYFSIPCIASEMEKPGKPSVCNNISLLDHSLLIVDDELINYQYLEILLKNRVKRIDHAKNGKEAVEMAQKNSYNLILMDMKMPVMGGIEATEILKQQFPELTIIAQTAFSLPEEKASALQAGCDDFLSKPIKKEDVMVMINKYVQ